MEKREENRQRRSLRVELDAGFGPVYGNSINVSPYGMGITMRTKRVFNPGDRLVLNVIHDGKKYRLIGRVRWFRFEVLNRSMGVEFEQPNVAFCEAIIRGKYRLPGTADNPFRKVYGNGESFEREYRENLKFGGLLIPFVGQFPPLNQTVQVELYPPNANDPIRIQGRVVLHQQEGFGIMVDNPEQLSDVFESHIQKS